jgi:hypothetical protein
MITGLRLEKSPDPFRVVQECANAPIESRFQTWSCVD